MVGSASYSRRNERPLAVELHAPDPPLHAAGERPAKAFERAAAGIGIARIDALVGAEDRQVFLVPAVADAQVVAIRRGVVPLRRMQQQLIQGAVHQIECGNVLGPWSRTALALAPRPVGGTGIEIVRNPEFADQRRRAAREIPRRPRTLRDLLDIARTNLLRRRGALAGHEVIRIVRIERLEIERRAVVPVTGVDAALRQRARERPTRRRTESIELREDRPVRIVSARHPRDLVEKRAEAIL